MKEIQEEKLLNGRKTYVSPFITVHEVDYDHALLEASVVGLDNTPGEAMNSDGGIFRTIGGSSGEIEDDSEVNNAKSWGSVWEEE